MACADADADASASASANANALCCTIESGRVPVANPIRDGGRFTAM